MLAATLGRAMRRTAGVLWRSCRGDGCEDRDLQLAERPRVGETRGRVAVDEEHQRDARIPGRRAADPGFGGAVAEDPHDLEVARDELGVRPPAAVRREHLDPVAGPERSRGTPPPTITARRPSGTSAATGPTADPASLEPREDLAGLDVRREHAPHDRRGVADGAGRRELGGNGRRREHVGREHRPARQVGGGRHGGDRSLRPPGAAPRPGPDSRGPSRTRAAEQDGDRPPRSSKRAASDDGASSEVHTVGRPLP